MILNTGLPHKQHRRNVVRTGDGDNMPSWVTTLTWVKGYTNGEHKLVASSNGITLNSYGLISIRAMLIQALGCEIEKPSP